MVKQLETIERSLTVSQPARRKRRRYDRRALRFIQRSPLALRAASRVYGRKTVLKLLIQYGSPSAIAKSDNALEQVLAWCRDIERDPVDCW